MKVTVIPVVVGAHGTIPKGLEKGSERLGNERMNRNCPDYSIIKIGQNT